MKTKFEKFMAAGIFALSAVVPCMAAEPFDESKVPVTASEFVSDFFVASVQDYAPANIYATGVPNAPSNLQFGEYDSLATDLQMIWAPSTSQDVWGYVAYYSTDDGLTWKCGGYTRADADGRLAKGIGKYATYTYKVAAFNEAGNSSWIQGSWNYGEYASPGAIAFGKYDAENKTLEYSWGASASDDLKHYVCEYSTDGGRTWKTACTVKWNRTFRTAKKVEGETWFRVYAEDNDGFKTPACAPAKFTPSTTTKA